MVDLIDTTEMYLKSVYELEEEGIIPLRARIAERLGHTGPTVSQTVARMERDELLMVGNDRHLELTGKGRGIAVEVMRKHRLAERLLVDVIGLDWSLAHEEACRWEHVMSEDVEARLVDILDDPARSPYGNLIPPLGFVPGAEELAELCRGTESLVDFLSGDDSAQEVVIARFGESLQTDPAMLDRFRDAEILPGHTVTLSREGQVYTLSAPGAPTVIDLPEELARHMYVEVEK